MNWQAMMKHEAWCPSHPKFKCPNCGSKLLVSKTVISGTCNTDGTVGMTNVCTSEIKEPCMCVTKDFSHKCTCHRDETVAAIEGVVDLAEEIKESLDYQDYEDTTDIRRRLKDALDRLNAMTGDGREDGEVAG